MRHVSRENGHLVQHVGGHRLQSRLLRSQAHPIQHEPGGDKPSPSHKQFCSPQHFQRYISIWYSQFPCSHINFTTPYTATFRYSHTNGCLLLQILPRCYDKSQAARSSPAQLPSLLWPSPRSARSSSPSAAYRLPLRPLPKTRRSSTLRRKENPTTMIMENQVHK